MPTVSSSSDRPTCGSDGRRRLSCPEVPRPGELPTRPPPSSRSARTTGRGTVARAPAAGAAGAAAAAAAAAIAASTAGRACAALLDAKERLWARVPRMELRTVVAAAGTGAEAATEGTAAAAFDEIGGGAAAAPAFSPLSLSTSLLKEESLWSAAAAMDAEGEKSASAADASRSDVAAAGDAPGASAAVCGHGPSPTPCRSSWELARAPIISAAEGALRRRGRTEGLVSSAAPMETLVAAGTGVGAGTRRDCCCGDGGGCVSGSTAVSRGDLRLLERASGAVVTAAPEATAAAAADRGLLTMAALARAALLGPPPAPRPPPPPLPSHVGGRGLRFALPAPPRPPVPAKLRPNDDRRPRLWTLPLPPTPSDRRPRLVTDAPIAVPNIVVAAPGTPGSGLGTPDESAKGVVAAGVAAACKEPLVCSAPPPPPPSGGGPGRR